MVQADAYYRYDILLGMRIVICILLYFRNLVVISILSMELYKVRHLVENAFLHLKRWRGIATRYAKRCASFLAAVQIRCISLWANII